MLDVFKKVQSNLVQKTAASPGKRSTIPSHPLCVLPMTLSLDTLAGLLPSKTSKCEKISGMCVQLCLCLCKCVKEAKVCNISR